MSFTVTDATIDAISLSDSGTTSSLLAIVLLVVLLGLREYFGDSGRSRQPLMVEMISLMIVPLLTAVGLIFLIQLASFQGLIN